MFKFLKIVHLIKMFRLIKMKIYGLEKYSPLLKKCSRVHNYLSSKIKKGNKRKGKVKLEKGKR
jgi:hypothetical protein